jgi:hypothetical protein
MGHALKIPEGNGKMIDSKHAGKPKSTPTGFTKWLRSGGFIERWAKETLISAPIVAVMILYIYFRAMIRFDSVFNWFTYACVTLAGSSIAGSYYARKSLKRYPNQSNVNSNSAAFGVPIEPK